MKVALFVTWLLPTMAMAGTILNSTVSYNVTKTPSTSCTNHGLVSSSTQYAVISSSATENATTIESAARSTVVITITTYQSNTVATSSLSPSSPTDLESFPIILPTSSSNGSSTTYSVTTSASESYSETSPTALPTSAVYSSSPVSSSSISSVNLSTTFTTDQVVTSPLPSSFSSYTGNSSTPSSTNFTTPSSELPSVHWPTLTTTSYNSSKSVPTIPQTTTVATSPLSSSYSDLESFPTLVPTNTSSTYIPISTITSHSPSNVYSTISTAVTSAIPPCDPENFPSIHPCIITSYSKAPSVLPSSYWLISTSNSSERPISNIISRLPSHSYTNLESFPVFTDASTFASSSFTTPIGTVYSTVYLTTYIDTTHTWTRPSTFKPSVHPTKSSISSAGQTTNTIATTSLASLSYSSLNTSSSNIPPSSTSGVESISTIPSFSSKVSSNIGLPTPTSASTPYWANSTISGPSMFSTSSRPLVITNPLRSTIASTGSVATDSEAGYPVPTYN
ncbi:hypothetical protein P280DRAFT_528098 [Massarina eburnea CBS 473.64]|uniref:Ig-like domain-containing protein n=1 Tax=Massarina eburnea CBS 473.64 TaxID=1395130 RepID=A0A6A6RTD2_9PLEO|nr:hypothetical protein P280DRAFT_528098 [Massarina eburnea CBS 473.64]